LIRTTRRTRTRETTIALRGIFERRQICITKTMSALLMGILSKDRLKYTLTFEIVPEKGRPPSRAKDQNCREDVAIELMSVEVN
jgi:hypothetical protein